MHGFWCDQPLHRFIPVHPSFYGRPFMGDLSWETFSLEGMRPARRCGNRDPLREAGVDLWKDLPNGRISQIGRCCDFRDRSEPESLTKAQLHGNLPRAWSTNVGGRQIVKHSTKG